MTGKDWDRALQKTGTAATNLARLIAGEIKALPGPHDQLQPVLAAIEELLERYAEGERTDELYAYMMRPRLAVEGL